MFTPRSVRGTSPGLALVVIATAQLMVVLDATIVNSSAPHPTRSRFFGNGLEGVITAYTLSFRGLLCRGDEPATSSCADSSLHLEPS